MGKLFSLCAAVATITGSSASAAPISFGDITHSRIFSTTNSAGIQDGDRLTVTVKDVSPDDNSGTIVVAKQDGVTLPLITGEASTDPSSYGEGTPYSTSLTDAWVLEFTNGTDTETALSPAVGNAQLPGQVEGITLVGGGTATAPIITWDNQLDPNSFDRLSITIYDLSNRYDSGRAIPIDLDGNGNTTLSLGNEADGFQVPEGTLDPNGSYTIRIETRLRRDDGSTLASNRAYFDYTPFDLPEGVEAVFLPVTDASAGPVAFRFDNGVAEQVLAYYDPVVAVG